MPISYGDSASRVYWRITQITTRDITSEICVMLETYKTCGKYNNILIRDALLISNVRNKDVAGIFLGTLRKCPNNWHFRQSDQVQSGKHLKCQALVTKIGLLHYKNSSYCCKQVRLD
jgi:hypothetical protein